MESRLKFNNILENLVMNWNLQKIPRILKFDKFGIPKATLYQLNLTYITSTSLLSLSYSIYLQKNSVVLVALLIRFYTRTQWWENKTNSVKQLRITSSLHNEN